MTCHATPSGLSAFALFSLTAVAACSSPPPPRERVVIPPQASAPRPPALGPVAAASSEVARGPVAIPTWIRQRVGNHAAISLIGANASSIDVLFGQFEHPDEAIVRFDRKTGCASEVIGPWPTLTKVVRGRSDIGGKADLTPPDLLALAHSESFKKELANILRIYTPHRRTGEDKLSFSLDGQKILLEATDEKVLASNDGGANFTWVEGQLVSMPIVAPNGSFGLVRICTSGRCVERLKVSQHKLGVLAFDAPSKVKIVSQPSMHDAIIEPAGQAFAIATRSDLSGKRTATKLCLDAFDATLVGLAGGTPTKSTCIPTTWVGDWHMLSASPNARFAAIAIVGKTPAGAHPSAGPVRLSIRSLPDGAEKQSIDVSGNWEAFQWHDVVVSDRGAVAFTTDRMSSGDPFHSTPIKAPPSSMVVRGAATREVGVGRPLGWIAVHELVFLDLGVDDPHGCGLVKTIDFGP